MALTAPTKQALDLLAQEEDSRKVNVAEITSDMKNSEFFRQNWDTLLLAAPNCLEILGNINLVAATPWAEATPLKGTFVYLKNSEYLRGALACISSQGNRSFLIARTNMTKIQMYSASVQDQVKIIYKGLADPNLPIAVVISRLGMLKDTADICQKSAKEIEDNMNLWAEFVYELHEVCSNNSASVEDQKRRTQTLLKLSQDDEKFREQQQKDADDALKKIDELLTDSKETYKKALDDMPTGMQLVGGAILMAVAESAGTAVNTYVAASNPIGAVGDASKGLLSLVKELKDDKAANDKSKDKDSEAQKGNGTKIDGKTDEPAGAAVTETAQKEAAEKKKQILTTTLARRFTRRARPKTTEGVLDNNEKPKTAGEKAKETEETTKAAEENPKNGYGEYDLSGKFMADDPALAVAPTVSASIELLKNIVVGLPTGINWDSVIPKDPNSASELATINYTLGRTLRDFKPRKDALASQLLVATVTEAIGIADELEAEGAKSTELRKSERPTRQSTIYKEWDESITRCYQNAVALDAASQAVPGGVGTRGVSLSLSQQTPEERIANTNYKQSIADQTVKSATNKLNSTRETYVATLGTYRETANNLQQVKETLQLARAEVARLDAKKLNLEEVKKVLVSCIGYLIELKDKIRKLVVFFSNLTSMIEICVTKQVIPFKKDLELYAQINATKAELYDNYYRDVIFRMVLRILSSFSLYQDVATMYIDVDSQVIQKGLTIVDRLVMVNTDPKLSNDAFFEMQRKTLSEYNTAAETTVHEIVKAKQDKILNSLQARVDGIGETLGKFPAQFQPEQNSIESQAAKIGTTLMAATAEAEAAQPSALEVTAPRRARFRTVTG